MELKGLTGSDMNKLTVATMQVDALRKQVTDAQATIAALQADNRTYINERHENMKQIEQLQARVRELEQWVQDQSTANLETMRHMDEMQSRAMDAESQLTQRTAELARVRKKLVETSLYLQQERDNRDSLAACVDRDVKTIKELRTLIAALPKVEGEISERFCTGSYYSSPYDYRSHVTFETALVALLKHRQGME